MAVAVAVIAGGVGAYLYYFAWSAPRLDVDRIEAFAFGPRDYQLRDLVLHDSDEERATLDRLVSLINEAALTSDRPADGGTGFLVILVRDDGLQYRLLPVDRGAAGERGLVGLSEGNEDFRGYLVSPEMARAIAELEARGDAVRE
jgi:hypothetical protein